MINFPQIGIKIGGADLMNVFVATFQMLLDKKVITENELVGYLTKAGFAFNQTTVKPEPVNVATNASGHFLNCGCERCQKERTIQ